MFSLVDWQTLLIKPIRNMAMGVAVFAEKSKQGESGETWLFSVVPQGWAEIIDIPYPYLKLCN